MPRTEKSILTLLYPYFDHCDGVLLLGSYWIILDRKQPFFYRPGKVYTEKKSVNKKHPNLGVFYLLIIIQGLESFLFTKVRIPEYRED